MSDIDGFTHYHRCDGCETRTETVEYIANKMYCSVCLRKKAVALESALQSANQRAEAAERDARLGQRLASLAYRTSDLEPPHWCIPETCGIGVDIYAAIDAAIHKDECE